MTRSWIVLLLDTATSMRSVNVRSLQERAISLRSRLTLQASLHVPVIQVSSRTFKTFQSFIASAWEVILAAEPDHVIVHPVTPAEWPRKAALAFLC